MSDNLEAQSEDCFHCGLPVPAGISFSVEFQKEQKPMCCAGCEAVATAIVTNGLDEFYLHRDKRQLRAEELIPDELKELDLYNDESLQRTFVHQREDSHKEASLILEGIVCAACIWLNERHVSSLPGVIDFHVNYATHRAQLVWDDEQIKLSDVLRAISIIGYHAHPFDPNRQEAIHKKERSLMIRKLGVAGIGMMQVMMLATGLYLGKYYGMAENVIQLLRWASLVITIPVMLYSSRVFFESAYKDLRSRRLGMDVPVALAIGAAFLASAWATIKGSGEVYFDSVTMFTFFLLFGRFLEQAARHKAGNIADELVRLVPATAHREIAEGRHEIIPVMELVVGDRVMVKAGEALPSDGVIINGGSHIDESLITGESHPVMRHPGDRVIAGSINHDSPITVEVDKIGEDTTLAAISRLLERAQSQKPKVAEMANRVASRFVAAVLVIATAVFSYWHFIVGSGDAFWITLSVLVVTCPCALSLATPVAMTAATGALTKLGILTTKGHAIETLAKITDIIFDKTGTLTVGKPELASVEVYPESMSREEALELTAVLEVFSDHPVATVFHPYAKDSKLRAENVRVVKGLGIEGAVAGTEYRLGNQRFIQEWLSNDSRLPVGSTRDTTAGTAGEGLSRIWLADRHQVVASFEIGDQLREQSLAVIQSMQKKGIRVHLLSGDQNATVAAVSKKLGITEYQAELLPEDKLAYLETLQENDGVIAMVGDGINDAPVLAAAQVSIAMGGGTQLAQASGDMVLLSDNIGQIVTAVEKSKEAITIIRQNITWAVGYNLSALPLAAAGFIAPWMAAIGMSLSSLVVVLNALRLKED